MKIPAGKIDSYVRQIDPKIKSILLYGPDVGLISERAATISGQIVDDIKDPFSVVDIQSDALKETPSLLADEASSMSLGGGRRLLKVRDAGNSATASVKQAMEEAQFSSEEAFILVVAGELPPASSLRKYFETAKNAASLPCYKEESRDLVPLVRKSMADDGYNIEHSAAQMLAERSQGDRMMVRSELEKLKLYMGDDKQIAIGDVEASIGVTAESTFSDVCIAVAGGNFSDLQRNLDKAYQQGYQPIALLRSVQNYFLRIYQVSAAIMGGDTEQDALKKLRPPVFFKQLPIFKSHLNSFTSRDGASLFRVMGLLRRAELQCKQTGASSEVMTSRCFLEIAAIAKRSAKRGY